MVPEACGLCKFRGDKGEEVRNVAIKVGGAGLKDSTSMRCGLSGRKNR